MKAIQVLAVAMITVSVSGDTILESPRITNWGEWGIWEKCPKGQFVRGMRLKTEKITYKFNEDNTALNGIQFFCAKPGEKVDYRRYITSSYANWGRWGQVFGCSGEPGLVTGFQIRADAPRGIFFGSVRADDTAANNLRIFCDHDTKNPIEGDGTNWGFWSTAQHCGSKEAVCAMQTQVEYSQGWRDDTALNNMEVECCELSTWSPPRNTTSSLPDSTDAETVEEKTNT